MICDHARARSPRPRCAWATANRHHAGPGHSYNVESANQTDRDDRRRQPARAATTCRGTVVGDFRMIFEWYGILDDSVR